MMDVEEVKVYFSELRLQLLRESIVAFRGPLGIRQYQGVAHRESELRFRLQMERLQRARGQPKGRLGA